MVYGFDAHQRDGALQAVTDELRGQRLLQVYAVGRRAGRTSSAFRPAGAVTEPTPDAA